MKKFTLLMMMLLMITGVQAKTTETTLWEDTYSGEIEISNTYVSTFSAGDVMRIYVTVPDGGANFKICYKGEGNSWIETTIPSVGSQWPWVNGGSTYYDVTFTSEDITALDGMNIYIYQGDNSTISSVTLITEAEPTSTTSVYSGTHDLDNWSGLQLNSDTYKTILAEAKKGDVLQLTYTSDAEGQINFCHGSTWSNLDNGYYAITATDEATTIEYEITSATTLEAIQLYGLVINGTNAVISAIDLLTYEDSYDAVPLTIGSNGIATFGSSKNLDFSALDLVPYYASSVTTGTVNLTSVTTTRAWAGYIVTGDAGTYDIPVADTEPEWVDAFAYLRFTGNYDGNWVYRSVYSDYSGDDEKIKTYYRYIFAKDDTEGIGFYKLPTDYTEDDNPYHILGAHKAYLETPTDVTPTSEARGVKLSFGGEVTGIQDVENKQLEQDNCDNTYYDLMGRRVEKPTKGLYIKNGKKYLF